ncbi:MAG: glycosyltransferase family 4 protein [bacterium]|nr:glycosyltransferase family 4 protein [bacterium]
MNCKKAYKIAVVGLRGIPHVMGGIETHCENLYPFLVRKEIELTIFTRKSYINPLIKEYKGIKLHVLPCIKNKYFESYFHTFAGVLTAWLKKVDLLHIHAIGPGLFVPLARLLGMKVVFTHHGPDYNRLKWNKFAKLILMAGEFFACTSAHAVITVAKYIDESIQSRFKRQTYNLPNGVIVKPGNHDRNILKKFGLMKNKYIFALGRFVPEKGFHDLIRAYRRFLSLNKNNKGIKLVIAGRADHNDNYSKTLLDSADENIVFTGFISDLTLRTIFSQAGLFVIPSYHEGLPLALLEALSYGLSSIASDIPPHHEIGLDKERYFKPGDIDALSAKMSQFCFKKLPAHQKKKEIFLIKKNYNWEKIAEKTYLIYLNLLKGSAARTGI